MSHLTPTDSAFKSNVPKRATRRNSKSLQNLSYPERKPYGLDLLKGLLTSFSTHSPFDTFASASVFDTCVSATAGSLAQQAMLLAIWGSPHLCFQDPLTPSRVRHHRQPVFSADLAWVRDLIHCQRFRNAGAVGWSSCQWLLPQN